LIHWQPGYVYPPVFFPPRVPLDALSAVFFVFIALAVAAVTLRRPANGIAAMIACTPFAYAHYLGATSLTVPKAALLGFIVALVVKRCSLGALRDPRVLRFSFALAAILVAMLLSGIGAEYRGVVAREIGKWIEYAAIFGAVVVAFANDPDDRPIWFSLAAITAVVAVLAITQEFIGAPSGLFVHGNSVPRIAGPLEGPNQLSAWLGISLPILLARTLVNRNGWFVLVTFLAAVADALTLSRSGIIAVIVGCAVVVVVTRPPRNVRLRFAGGALMLAVILVVLGVSIGLQARFFSFAEVPQPDHLGTRAELWKAALDLWRTSPLVGIGAGNYEFELARVGLVDVQTHANSLYLESLADMGLVGFAAALFLVYVSIQTFAQSALRRPLVIGALAASVVLALHQIFDYVVFFPKVGAFWWIVLGIGTVELMNGRHDTRTFDVAA
jgi:O-antigen ligase